MSYIAMMNKLAEEFSSEEIILTSFENDRQRLKDLGINLLPAWLIENQVLRINPGDYEMIRTQILMKSNRQHGEQDE